MLTLLVIIIIVSVQISAKFYNTEDLYLQKASDVPLEEQITFHLYHKSDLATDDQIFIDDVNSLQESRFNPKLKTIFLVHGWTHHRDSPWLIEMREVTAALYPMNVIVVDWSGMSHFIYTQARIYTPLAGLQLGRLCAFLIKTTGVTPTSLHLLGHSMGAHIAAGGAHHVKVTTGQKVGRVTGLDPASPLYMWPYAVEEEERLDADDALLVDVIHSNGRRLGILEPIGHLDYYPNGGSLQPGCDLWFCSHMAACEFWIASLKNPDLFKAYMYGSWDEYLEADKRLKKSMPMGIAANPSIPHGLYFLETRNLEKLYVQSETTILDSL